MRIAGIDVHKKKLGVVVADVEVEENYEFERRWYGSNPEQLQGLAEWLVEQQVEEVVMESTAQYWQPVWGALERYWKPTCEKREGAGRMSGTLHLAQALSNRGRRGRKKDFRDAERSVKRLISQELILSFVPDAEQRLWRTLTRAKYQLRRDKVRLQNQLEALLEEAHIKLSSLVSDLLGVSARRMLKALAEGETDPAALAALADQRLRATSAQLRDALGACTELNPVYRRLVKMALDELQLIRAADRPTGPGDCRSAAPASGCRRAAGRSPRPGSGFGAANHRRGGCCGSDLRLRQESLLVGGGMPGRGRERECEPQPALTQAQPSDAPHSQSSCQCCRQTQRENLRDRLSSIGAPLRTQQNHWSDCASPASVDLDYFAQRCPL
jgi:Transposase